MSIVEILSNPHLVQRAIKDISKHVAFITGISVVELQGSSRRWEVSIIRMYFIAYCIEMGFRKTDMAEFLDRDHSTIWGIYDRHCESILTYHWVVASFRNFKEQIDVAMGTSKKAG